MIRTPKTKSENNVQTELHEHNSSRHKTHISHNYQSRKGRILLEIREQTSLFQFNSISFNYVDEMFEFCYAPRIYSSSTIAGCGIDVRSRALGPRKQLVFPDSNMRINHQNITKEDFKMRTVFPCGLLIISANFHKLNVGCSVQLVFEIP